jgi:hypothetical protein
MLFSLYITATAQVAYRDTDRARLRCTEPSSSSTLELHLFLRLQLVGITFNLEFRTWTRLVPESRFQSPLFLDHCPSLLLSLAVQKLENSLRIRRAASDWETPDAKQQRLTVGWCYWYSSFSFIPSADVGLNNYIVDPDTRNSCSFYLPVVHNKQ